MKIRNLIPLSGVVDLLLWSALLLAALLFNLPDTIPAGIAYCIFTVLFLVILREALQWRIVRSKVLNRKQVERILMGFSFTLSCFFAFTFLLYFFGINGGLIPPLVYLILITPWDWERSSQNYPFIKDAIYMEAAAGNAVKPVPDLILVPDTVPVTWSKPGKQGSIMVSQAVLDAPPEQKHFLFSHELAHFKKGHFWRLRLMQFLLFSFVSLTPFAVLQLTSPAHRAAYRLIHPVDYLPPLLALTAANIISIMVEKFIRGNFEREADLAAMNDTQNPDEAKNALKLLMIEQKEKKEIFDIQEIPRQRLSSIEAHFPTPLPGEEQEFLTYCCLNFACNQECVFCASDKTRKNSKVIVELEQFRELLKKDRGPHKRIILSGGEPLIHPGIEKIINMAAGSYREVVLMTNGVLLAERSTVFRLLGQGGVTEVTVPIYGADAAVHDRFTRNKGSFARLIQAMGNISEIPGVKLHLKFLFSKPTLDENIKILESIKKGKIPSPDFLSLTHLIAGVKSQGMVKELYPTFGEAKKSLNELVGSMADFPFTLKHIPLCWLEPGIREIVIKKETRSAVFTNLLYLAPGQELSFRTIIPEEMPGCKECLLRARCSRFYPGDEKSVIHLRQCFPNKKFFGGAGGDFSKKPPARRRQEN